VIESQKKKKHLRYILFGLMVIALFMRLLLIYLRWINPDEGAHLMAARLFILGYMPIIDYGARQPIYLFSLVGLLKVFGNSYLFARLLPVLVSVATGFILYILSKRLYDQKMGVIAAALYWFAPLPFIWSGIVKTEPLAIFFVCVAVYLFSYSFGDRFLRSGAMLLTGIFAAMAYFSRQTTLYLPFAILIFQLLRRDINKSGALRQLFLFVLGYAGLLVSVGAFFLKKLPLDKMIFTQLNPFNLIYNRLAHLFGRLPDEYRVVDTEGFRILNQSIDYTMESWKDATLFSLFVIVAALFTIAGWWRRRNQFQIQQHKGILFFTLWFFSVLLFYAFQSVNRGFYTQYMVEAYPPLLLLAARYIKNGFADFKKPAFYSAAVLTCSFFTLYILQRLFWAFYPGLFLYFVFSFIVTALLFYWLRQEKKKRLYILTTVIVVLFTTVIYYLMYTLHMGIIAIVAVILFCTYIALRYLLKRRVQRPGLFAANYVIVSAFLVTALYCGHLIGPRYESVWSPYSVRQTVACLKSHGSPSDDILSGGMIWTFESGFVAWQNVAHPTEFLKKKDTDFENDFNNDPPVFLIFDGYTERKFRRYMKFLQQRLPEQYNKVAVVSGSRYPVEIYKLKENLLPLPAGKNEPSEMSL
jgi:4-amino-4-deoxy-L-arabinose transferase-like glycosyltransferase